MDRFWESHSSAITVRSVSYFSVVTPGYMVFRQQDDYNCFDNGTMEIRIGQIHLNGTVLLNPVCRENLENSEYINVSMTLYFDDHNRTFSH